MLVLLLPLVVVVVLVLGRIYVPVQWPDAHAGSRCLVPHELIHVVVFLLRRLGGLQEGPIAAFILLLVFLLFWACFLFPRDFFFVPILLFRACFC